jgi:hypothetical protein
MSEGLVIGLQEWAGICRALLTGRLVFVVRKGGIHERHGGFFSPEHERFALLPTWLHQRPDRLKPAFTEVLAEPAPPADAIPVTGWCEVSKVWKATDLSRILRLGDELAWTEEELANRFSYRGQPFLFVLALRAWRLPAPQIIANHPSYAGCRSWIALRESITTAGSVAAVDDAGFASRLQRISAQLESP